MSFSDTANAKKYASIAEVAAAQAKLSADKLEGAPDYANQAAASAAASAFSAQAAISAESVVDNLASSASESATSAAASAAAAGDAAAAAIGRSVRAPDGEALASLPAAEVRQGTIPAFDENGDVTVKPLTDFAILDSSGKIPVSVIPSIALTEPYVVDSQEQMLALNAQIGDIAKRTDLGYSFCLASSPASMLSNWVQLTDDVLAQLGQSTGAASVGAVDDSGSPTTVQLSLASKANKSNLSAQTGATTIGAVNSAGAATTVQSAISEKIDSAVISATTAAAVIGTTHRGTLALDLNAIDRRPDGYGNSIASVLGSGNDVEINQLYSIPSQINLESGKLLSGAGGGVYITNQTQSGVVSDARSSTNKDFVQIKGIKFSGSVLDTDGSPAAIAAYGAFLRDSEYAVIDGLYASGFTGGVANINTTSSVIKNVRATNTVYHPSQVRGGYGVFLDETRQALVDGVQFDAGSGNNGRHMLYVSRGGGGNSYDGCQNTLAVNMIGKYRNKDDRNFWGINIRKSTRTVVSNFIIDGAPSGVSYNVENGFIEKGITSNGTISVLKYADGIGVYGVSQTYDSTSNKVTGFLDTALVLEVKPKDSTLTGADCIGYSLSGTNGRVSNLVTNISTAGNPFLIQPGASNIIIDGVMDYVSDGSSDTLAAMFTFTGGPATCSNITVRGIKTSRPMFSRLSSVTDLTVDYQRKARISVSSGVVTKIDAETITGTVTLTTTGLTVAFPSHVTQSAIEGAIVNCIGPYQAVIISYASKVLTISTYTISGSVLNPQTTAVALNVILSS